MGGMKVTSEFDKGWNVKTHPVGEVHFQGQDTDVLRTGLGGVGSNAVGVDTVCTIDAVDTVDTVNGWHFWRERASSEEEGWKRRGDEREGREAAMTRFYRTEMEIPLVPFSGSYHPKTGNRSVRRSK